MTNQELQQPSIWIMFAQGVRRSDHLKYDSIFVSSATTKREEAMRELNDQFKHVFSDEKFGWRTVVQIVRLKWPEICYRLRDYIDFDDDECDGDEGPDEPNGPAERDVEVPPLFAELIEQINWKN